MSEHTNQFKEKALNNIFYENNEKYNTNAIFAYQTDNKLIHNDADTVQKYQIEESNEEDLQVYIDDVNQIVGDNIFQEYTKGQKQKTTSIVPKLQLNQNNFFNSKSNQVATYNEDINMEENNSSQNSKVIINESQDYSSEQDSQIFQFDQDFQTYSKKQVEEKLDIQDQNIQNISEQKEYESQCFVKMFQLEHSTLPIQNISNLKLANDKRSLYKQKFIALFKQLKQMKQKKEDLLNLKNMFHNITSQNFSILVQTDPFSQKLFQKDLLIHFRKDYCSIMNENNKILERNQQKILNFQDQLFQYNRETEKFSKLTRNDVYDFNLKNQEMNENQKLWSICMSQNGKWIAQIEYQTAPDIELDLNYDGMLKGFTNYLKHKRKQKKVQEKKSNTNNDENILESNQKSDNAPQNDKPILKEIFEDRQGNLREHLQVIFQKLEKHLQNNKEQVKFDEHTHFFSNIHIIRLINRYEGIFFGASANIRLRRFLLENFRQIILEKQGVSRLKYESLTEFKISYKRHLSNMKVLLKERKQNQDQFQEYELQIDLPSEYLYSQKNQQNGRLLNLQSFIEKQMEAPETLIDMTIEQAHITDNLADSGLLCIVLLIKIVARIDRRNKVFYQSIFCPNIKINKDIKKIYFQQKQRDYSTNAEIKKHTFQDYFQGVKGFLSQRSKSQCKFNQSQDKFDKHLKEYIQKQQLIENLKNNQFTPKSFEFNGDLINTDALYAQWSTDVLVIASQIENLKLLENKKIDVDDNLIKSQLNLKGVESLVLTNHKIEIKFVKHLQNSQDQESYIINKNQQYDSFFIQSVFLIQQNYQNDQYYLETQNIRVDFRQKMNYNLNEKVYQTDFFESIPQIQKGKMLQLNFFNSLIEYNICHRSVFTKLDYETELETISKNDQMVSRMTTNQSNLQFVALNSTHMVYTKLMFIKTDESTLALQLDLYTLINPNDQPPINQNTGKAELIVDDAQWTPDGQFVVFVLKGNNKNQSNNGQNFSQITHGIFCILPRMGISLVAIMNPTRFNIPRKLKLLNKFGQQIQNKDQPDEKEEDIIRNQQKFIQLIVSESVNQKKRVYDKIWQNFQNKWTIEVKNDEQPRNFQNQQNQDSNENHLSLFLSNGGEIIFEFSMNYNSLNSSEQAIKLFNISEQKNQQNQKRNQQKQNSPKNQYQEKNIKQINEKNEIAFLRFCLTQPEISQSSQFLMRIPDFLDKILPLQYYEKLQDLYDKDLHQIQELKIQKRQKKQENKSSRQSEIKINQGDSKARIQMIGNSIFNGNTANFDANYQILLLNRQNEKFDAIKIVSAFQKLIIFCRWADISASGNQSATELQTQSYLSLNFKQWLVTIVQDCFMIMLQLGEPHLGLMILKLAENYFSARNDPSEYYLQKKMNSFISTPENENQDGEEQTLQLEMHQIFLNSSKTYDSIINSLKDPQGEMYFQSSSEHRKQTEINLLQDLMPIHYPINFYHNVNDEYDTQCLFAFNQTYQELQKYRFGPFVLNFPINDQGSTNIQLLSLRNLFQNQYILLIYYCMIQFRNYQSKSFNILFLVVASFINQRQLDPSFLRDFQEVMNILRINYLKKEKTSETEMFLGAMDQFKEFNKIKQSWSDNLAQQFYRAVKFNQIYNKSQKYLRLSEPFHKEEILDGHQKFSQVIQKKIFKKNENYQNLINIWEYTKIEYNKLYGENYQNEKESQVNDQQIQRQNLDQNIHTKILQNYIVQEYEVKNFVQVLQNFLIIQQEDEEQEHPALKQFEAIVQKYAIFQQKIMQIFKQSYSQLKSSDDEEEEKESSDSQTSRSSSGSSSSSYNKQDKSNFQAKDIVSDQKLELHTPMKINKSQNSIIINPVMNKLPSIDLLKPNNGQVSLYTLDKLYSINMHNINQCFQAFKHFLSSNPSINQIKPKEENHPKLTQIQIDFVLDQFKNFKGHKPQISYFKTNNTMIFDLLKSVHIPLSLENDQSIEVLKKNIFIIKSQFENALMHRQYLIVEKNEIEQKMILSEYNYISKKVIADTKIDNKTTLDQLKQELTLRSIEIINLIQVYISLQPNSAASSVHAEQDEIEADLTLQLEQFDEVKPVLRNCLADTQGKLINYIYWKLTAFFQQQEKDLVQLNNFKIQSLEDEFKSFKKVVSQNKKVWLTNINELCAKIKIKSVYDSLVEDFKDVRDELHYNISNFEQNNLHIQCSLEQVIEIQNQVIKQEKNLSKLMPKLIITWNSMPDAIQKNLIFRACRQSIVNIHKTLKYVHLKQINFWGISQNFIMQNTIDEQFKSSIENKQKQDQQNEIFIQFEKMQIDTNKLLNKFPFVFQTIPKALNIQDKFIYLFFEVFSKNQSKQKDKQNFNANYKILHQFLFDLELFLQCFIYMNNQKDFKPLEYQRRHSFIDKDEFSFLFETETHLGKNPLGRIFQKIQQNLETEENFIDYFYKINVKKYMNETLNRFLGIFDCLIKLQIQKYLIWQFRNNLLNEEQKQIELLQHEIEHINQMCKSLNFVKYDSYNEKRISDFDGEAQSLFYLQQKEFQFKENQFLLFNIIDVQSQMTQILCFLQQLISKHKSHFQIENIKNEVYDGVKNSYVKDIILIILKLKSIKFVNDDNKLLIWNLTTEIQKISDDKNQSVVKLIQASKMMMKPTKNLQNDFKNWQQFLNEIYLSHISSYHVLNFDILQVFSEKYQEYELKDQESDKYKGMNDSEIFKNILQAFISQNFISLKSGINKFNYQIIKKLVSFERFLLNEKDQNRLQTHKEYQNMMLFLPNSGQSQLLISLNLNQDVKLPRMHEYALYVTQYQPQQIKDDEIPDSEDILKEDQKIELINKNIDFPFPAKNPFDLYLKACQIQIKRQKQSKVYLEDQDQDNMYNHNFKYYKNNGVLEVQQVDHSNEQIYDDILKKKLIQEEKKNQIQNDINIGEMKLEKKENVPIVEDQELKKIDWLKVKPFQLIKMPLNTKQVNQNLSLNELGNKEKLEPFKLYIIN